MTNVNATRRGIQPTRRSVVRGAAWSMPVVAVAATAPAYAASTCANPRLYRLDWGTSTYSHTTADASVATVLSTNGGPTVYAHFATIFRGNGRGDGNVPGSNPVESRNLSVPPGTGTGTTQDPVITSLGGLGAGERGMRLQQTSPQGYANRQDVTVTFRSGAAADSSPVNIQNLSVYIVDIDALTTNPYSDRVALSSASAYTATRDAAIVGAGSTAGEGSTGTGPWRNSTTGNQPENEAGARVQLTWDDDYAARMSSFGLAYWTNTGATGNNAGQYHRIYLSDFTFKVCP